MYGINMIQIEYNDQTYVQWAENLIKNNKINVLLMQ